MWMSVPQMPLAFTSIRSSSSATAGTGTSRTLISTGFSMNAAFMKSSFHRAAASTSCWNRVHPSMPDAWMISTGTSVKKECTIHTTIGTWKPMYAIRSPIGVLFKLNAWYQVYSGTHREETSFGAALLAGVACGALPDLGAAGRLIRSL
jgi:hypothetical protein